MLRPMRFAELCCSGWQCRADYPAYSKEILQTLQCTYSTQTDSLTLFFLSRKAKADYISYAFKRHSSSRQQYIYYSEVNDYMGKITGFLKDVVSEMRKVSWPKRKQLTRYTIVVITTVVFMAIYFGLVDLGISEVMEWYLAL